MPRLAVSCDGHSLGWYIVKAVIVGFLAEVVVKAAANVVCGACIRRPTDLSRHKCFAMRSNMTSNTLCTATVCTILLHKWLPL